jgi:hypothetical protein
MIVKNQGVNPLPFSHDSYRGKRRTATVTFVDCRVGGSSTIEILPSNEYETTSY